MYCDTYAILIIWDPRTCLNMPSVLQMAWFACSCYSLSLTPSGHPQGLHTQHLASVSRHKNQSDSSQMICRPCYKSTLTHPCHGSYLFQNSLTVRLKWSGATMCMNHMHSLAVNKSMFTYQSLFTALLPIHGITTFGTVMEIPKTKLKKSALLMVITFNTHFHATQTW
jgi:hypothetical protein